jgi:uncharacterized protein (UPF0210 family)
MIAAGILSLAGCGFTPFLGPILNIGVMWMNGEAHKYYDADQQTVVDAIDQAARDLEFVTVEKEVKGNTIYIKIDDLSVASREEEANRFNIKIHKVQHNVTKLSIRINTWGDKPYADLMFRKVDTYPGVKSFKSVKQLEKAYYGRR